MLFSRISTDESRVDCTKQLSGLYSGSACWVVGSASLLFKEQISDVQSSGLPVLACNLSGRNAKGGWAIKPDIWTTYDPTARFPLSIYRDPTILKFCNAARARDIVPSTDDKLCDMPNLYFIENGLRSYDDFFGLHHTNINNSKDSFIQLLDIGYRLGFRTFYCVGVELAIRPSKAQLDLAESVGVKYEDFHTMHETPKHGYLRQSTLGAFVDEVARMGFSGEQRDAITALESVERESQYAFNEVKPLSSAIAADRHYYNTVQYLRLARKNMKLCGINLYATSRTSRLCPFFPYISTEDVSDMNQQPDDNLTGLYTGRNQHIDLPDHRDIKPYDFENYRAGGCGCGGSKKPHEHPKPVEKQAGLELQEPIRLANDVVIEEVL